VHAAVAGGLMSATVATTGVGATVRKCMNDIPWYLYE
jgi:hypothetical protein